ncbi:efflux transporter outer membrane subunit [Kangiella koreensis]|uniref:RND efflux system, outer membrane lipoprotein, NodT family n=1 Tax=Kangiella koreensis (strain DSM 16069 / JCM 12317 / KCTC 12182 / SW-125) TaxID=523791 RepID=C7R6Y2_KANKD|nr:efflux transporter outer membrane subunit [Kangiella koreensis]ACV27438.1 RND efflux system, outer membrane lipoprotein, NodT family [Kangiella koreensis DSM 16069]
MSIRFPFALLLLSTVASCAVTPDFKEPEPPSVSQYTGSDDAVVIGSNKKLATGQTLQWVDATDQQWWQQFQSDSLNLLVEKVLTQNPSLLAASAQLRSAEELYQARVGTTRYPKVSADVSAQRQRFNPGVFGQQATPQEFSIYNAGVDVSYQLDLSGGNSRALEGLASRVDYQRYELEGTQLALVATVLNTAFNQAKLRSQLEVTEQLVAKQEQQLDIVKQQLELGQVSKHEVLMLQSEVELTRANIPVFRNQIQKTEHLLATMAGETPDSENIPDFNMQDFGLPESLPLIIPSELVRQRPDIQAAESLIQAANAEYGVAIANMYPSINLNGQIGSQALSAGSLFSSESAVWSLIGQLTQPLFDPGLPAEKRAALAEFEAATSNYQYVVLEALREVADTLRQLENDAQKLNALSDSNQSSEEAMQITARRHELGAASYIELLLAQQQYLSTRMQLIDAQSQQLINSVSLYLAMGAKPSLSQPDVQ